MMMMKEKEKTGVGDDDDDDDDDDEIGPWLPKFVKKIFDPSHPQNIL